MLVDTANRVSWMQRSNRLTNNISMNFLHKSPSAEPNVLSFPSFPFNVEGCLDLGDRFTKGLLGSAPAVAEPNEAVFEAIWTTGATFSFMNDSSSLLILETALSPRFRSNVKLQMTLLLRERDQERRGATKRSSWRHRGREIRDVQPKAQRQSFACVSCASQELPVDYGE